VRLEGLDHDLIGNRTRDLPACIIVPQPTTLPRAPKTDGNLVKSVLSYWGDTLSLASLYQCRPCNMLIESWNSVLKLVTDLTN
jgi:hypothetical protein